MVSRKMEAAIGTTDTRTKIQSKQYKFWKCWQRRLATGQGVNEPWAKEDGVEPVKGDGRQQY